MSSHKTIMWWKKLFKSFFKIFKFRDFKGAFWNCTKYIFAKFEYCAKQVIYSSSPDCKLSNGAPFAYILRIQIFFELKKMAYKLTISRKLNTFLKNSTEFGLSDKFPTKMITKCCIFLFLSNMV